VKRIPEPELMDEDEQARAYSEADFDEPHNRFVSLFQEIFGSDAPGRFALDLGCGPADVTVRFARAYSHYVVHGVDGSKAMLQYGRRRLAQHPDVQERIELFCGVLPQVSLPMEHYDVVMSNSLLHHLSEPMILWESVGRYVRPGSCVFIMDLMRPRTTDEVDELVERYASGEPEVLRRDFYNSLLSAFEPGEVESQLREAGMSYLAVKVVSDRHVTISGRAR
jgi:SAM-dependent methyltransferase